MKCILLDVAFHHFEKHLDKVLSEEEPSSIDCHLLGAKLEPGVQS